MSIEKPPVDDANLSNYLIRALTSVNSAIDACKTFVTSSIIKSPQKGKFYFVEKANNQVGETGLYFYNGSDFIKLANSASPALSLGESHTDAYYGDFGKIAYEHSFEAGNPHGLSKSDLNLDKVDNTSDKLKPLSDATKAELSKYVLSTRKVNGKALSADVVLTTDNVNPSVNRRYLTLDQFNAVSAPATSANDGYLLAADWSTFNNKQSISEKNTINGYVGLSALKIVFKNTANTFSSLMSNTNTAAREYIFPDVNGTVAMRSDIPATISATSPLNYNSTTGSLNISSANSTQSGALTSTDWNIFNSKGNGTVTLVSGTGSVSGLSLSGNITSSGNLTLGGAITGNLAVNISGNANTVTNLNMSGEATSFGTTVTLVNNSVISKLLTGLSTVAGTVTSSDSLVGAIGKLVGNLATVIRSDLNVNQSSHGFIIGDVLYFNGTTYVKAKSDAGATLGLFIVSTVIDSNNFTLVTSGYITGLSGLIAGQYYYVSDATAGLLTSTEPTTLSHYSNPIFFALSATSGYVLSMRPSLIAASFNLYAWLYNGLATTGTYSGWNDIVLDIAVKGVGSNDPTWTTFRNGINAFTFSATAMKEVWGVVHINHDYKPGGQVLFHTHWSTAGTNTGTCRWGLEYSIAKGHGQEAFPVTSTTYIEAAASGTAYIHYVSEMSVSFPVTSIEPDALILARVFRDAAHANDTLTDVAFLLKMDAHYETDRMATKNRNVATGSFYV